MAATASQVPNPVAVSADARAGAAENRASEERAKWGRALNLPCQVSVDLAFPGFTVADLLKLRRGSVISTRWSTSRDVPLRVNGLLVGWSEFEVINQRLAVRLTELT